MHFARSLWGHSSKLPVVTSGSREEDVGVSSISCWNSWQGSSSFWCDEPSTVGVNIWRLPLGHCEATWQRCSTDLGQWSTGRWLKGETNANTANNCIAFTLELLFYDEVRSVLKSLCQGVLFLYRKAPWRESSLAFQGLSPKCTCPSAHGKSESPLRRQWRW